MHLRTTKVIESVFASVRLWTEKTKGSGTRVACPIRGILTRSVSEATPTSQLISQRALGRRAPFH